MDALIQSSTDLVNLLKWRMRNDFDNVLAVTGDEGDGKSTCGMHLAKTIDPGFNPVTDCIFNFEDWTHKFDLEERGHVYLLDEGGNLAFNRDWSNSENKEVQHILREARQFNHTIIFCIPRLAWLDKNLREHRVRWWLNCRTQAGRRGYADLAVRQRAKFPNEDVWFEDTGTTLTFPKYPDEAEWRAYADRKAQVAKDRVRAWQEERAYERERFAYRRARFEERVENGGKKRRRRGVSSLESSSTPPLPPLNGG